MAPRFGSALSGAVALTLLSCSPAGDSAPDLAAGNGWTREIAPGQSTAAVYLTITNRGSGEDRLLGVAATPPASATLHSTSNEGGVARMRPLKEGIEIAPKSTVELKPGGAHIMMTGTAQRLKPGQTFDLILRFARSGKQPILIRVVPAGGDEPGHAM